ncbi:MAG: RDD family protein [Polyangiaceae bacterium]|nr:RDD family protein [Polyangiaceae bacterium]
MRVSHNQPAPIDTSAEVETPEHVRFQHQVAGPARRALAYLIDLFIRAMIVGLFGIIVAIAGFAAGIEMRGVSTGIMAVIYFGVEWCYYVLFETLWSGRSPGKKVLHLRVITDTGRPLHYLDSMLRNVLRAGDLLPNLYALGLVIMGRDPKFRRLGDMVAGTIVVVEERFDVSERLHVHPIPSPFEMAALPQRVPISGEEMDALELFLRRAPKLHPARASELADIVAPIFRQTRRRSISG